MLDNDEMGGWNDVIMGDLVSVFSDDLLEINEEEEERGNK